jgi:hypothetical protein
VSKLMHGAMQLLLSSNLPAPAAAGECQMLIETVRCVY